MDVVQIRRATLRSYLASLFLFLCLMVLSLIVFFFSVRNHVERETRQTVLLNVARESVHIESMLETQFHALEAFSALIAEGDTLTDSANLRVIHHISEKSDFKLVALIDAQGNAFYSNGENKNVSARRYFREAIAGQRSISDPLESMVDGSTCVILAVPVVRDGEVTGVLGGSYELSALSHMMFEGLYDDAGYAMILSADGKVIACDTDRQTAKLCANDNFFAYCDALTFTETDTAQSLIESLCARESGSVRFSAEGGELSYMAYEPMEIGSWMLLYIAPVDKVYEPFEFIERAEIVLAAVLALGCGLMLLWLWKQNHLSQRKLINYAQTDPLTSISNKASTEELISAWLAGPQRKGIQAFFFLDIDSFKTINDVCGHAAGDEVLRQVSRLMREEFRADDIVGRIGGDEFVIFMKNIPHTGIAVEHARILCDKVRELEIPDFGRGRISLSIGIAFAPDHGETYRRLFVNADKACYMSKAKGKNSYTEFAGGGVKAKRIER